MPARRSARRETPPGGIDSGHREAVGTSVDAFRRILRALRIAARRTQTKAGISAAQLFVLRAIEDGHEASLSEIASRTLTDRSSVAAVVERLIESGLVSRSVSRVDRRRAAVVITREGRTRLKRAPQAPTALLVQGLDALPDRQLRALAAGLAALSDAMGLGEQPAGMLFDDAESSPRRRSRPEA